MSTEYRKGYNDGIKSERARCMQVIRSKQKEYATPQRERASILAVLETIETWVTSGRGIER